ncbi:MAG: FAD-dependent oxidoreductase, partial [Leptolyngbyaceae cyanobacterium SM2_5_2]|nr:FAD-dependent oxidoreductase [Leptolyngbyaceae cyanobacterium SM2_5_2]
MASRLSPASVDPVYQPVSPGLQLSRLPQAKHFNGRPQLHPLPATPEIWECQVAVIGGSLGGVAAAAHAMATGAQTCLIEVSPWLGGQISSQGVSALDESLRMRQANNFSPSWMHFRNLIKQQVVHLPDWSPTGNIRPVSAINSCWVGTLCFPPEAGALAAGQLLQEAKATADQSRWATMTAFKGAEFDTSGQRVTALYGMR